MDKFCTWRIWLSISIHPLLKINQIPTYPPALLRSFSPILKVVQSSLKQARTNGKRSANAIMQF